MSLTQRGRRALSPSTWGSERLVLVLLGALLCGVVLLNKPGVFTPDTKPEVFLAPWRTLSRFGSWWQDGPFLGAPNFNVGLAPIAGVLGLIEAIVPPPWLAMRVWRIGLLLLAAWGARRLYVALVRGSAADRPAGRVAVAIAYVANPYLLLGGNTTPTMLPYALLPWLVLAWLRGFRDGSWRWAAVAALTLTAMGGINSGVVVALQLIVLVPLVVHSVAVDGARLRTVAGSLAKTVVLYVPLAAYWLLPSLGAIGVGSQVAAATESLESINAANAFPEVLRGLGFWPLYGRDGHGPFLPGLIGYVDHRLLVALSFGPVLLAAVGARLSRSPARLFAVLSVLVATVVMVGSFPYAAPAAAGRGLGWLLTHVPGAIALRTTNKAGGVLELGLAVLVAVGATQASGWLARRFPVRRRWEALAVMGGVLAVALAAVAPALSGHLFPVTMDIPGYWKAAADTVNAETAADARVLTVPGIAQADYAWGYRGPDEVGSSLFEPESEFRIATPTGNSFASGVLGGVDQRLYQGSASPGTVSALGDYLGATTVVGRFDQLFDTPVGAVVGRQLAVDPALRSLGGFGPSATANGAPHALQVYSVTGSQGPPAKAHAAQGALLLDGDGTALPDLVSSGLVASHPGLVLAGSLTSGQTNQAIADGASIVLTDSNGRRAWNGGRPDATGALVAAGATPSSTRAVFGPGDQTVAQYEGDATLTTKGSGLLFGPFGGGGSSLAFDGDRSTAWRFGNFGTATGNSVTVHLDAARSIPAVSIQQTADAGNRIDSVRVTSTGPGGARSSVRATLGPWSTFPTVMTPGAGRFDTVTIEVTGATQDGYGPVGISEIAIPGVTVHKIGRLPVALGQRLSGLVARNPQALASTPLDVVMHRQAGTDELSREEPGLDRDFVLPDARTFTVSGTLRLATGVSDDQIDALAGVSSGGAARAESSSRAFWNPDVRASRAIDDANGHPDQDTAWVPADPVVGEWIKVGFAARELSSFTVTQTGESTATKAWVRVDDGTAFTVNLAQGTSTVRLPDKVLAHSVQLVITERTGAGEVRISNLSLPRMSKATPDPGRCRPIGTVDGKVLRARVTGSLDDLLAGQSVPFEGCGALALGEGTHEVRSNDSLAVDDLRLLDRRSMEATPAPSLTTLRYDPSAMTLRLDSDCRPCYLTTGQAFDSRWVGHVGERSLGTPIVLDGYAAGWRVDAPAGSVVTMSAGPARWAPWVWGLTVLAVVLIALLALWLGRARAPVDAVDRFSGLDHPMVVPVCAAGGVVGAWLTVGPYAALLVAVVCLTQAFSPPHLRLIGSISAAVVGLVVVVWSADLGASTTRSAQLIQHNVLGNVLGGAAVWLLVLAVVSDLWPTRRLRASSRWRPLRINEREKGSQ